MPRVPLILTKTFKNMTDLEKYITECIEKNEDYQSDLSGMVEAEYGQLYISCSFSVQCEGYYDCDYINGTGAFEETYYKFEIDDITVYDEDDNKVDVNIDAIERELNQR